MQYLTQSLKQCKENSESVERYNVTWNPCCGVSCMLGWCQWSPLWRCFPVSPQSVVGRRGMAAATHWVSGRNIWLLSLSLGAASATLSRAISTLHLAAVTCQQAQFQWEPEFCSLSYRVGPEDMGQAEGAACGVSQALLPEPGASWGTDPSEPGSGTLQQW